MAYYAAAPWIWVESGLWGAAACLDRRSGQSLACQIVLSVLLSTLTNPSVLERFGWHNPPGQVLLGGLVKRYSALGSCLVSKSTFCCSSGFLLAYAVSVSSVCGCRNSSYTIRGLHQHPEAAPS